MVNKEENLEMLIGSGRYFDEAWNWYGAKYLKLSVEKAWLWLLGVMCIVIFGIHILAVQTFFPLTKSIPFVMYVDNTSDDLHVIKKLGNLNKSDPQITLAEYLVSHYVKLREEYDYNKIEEQKTFIKANSSRLVYDRYINDLDVNLNSNSPILKYKKEGKRTITILDVEIYGASSNSAKVHFTAYDNLTNTSKEYNIMLRFTLSSVVSAALKLVPLEFRVVSYGK